MAWLAAIVRAIVESLLARYAPDRTNVATPAERDTAHLRRAGRRIRDWMRAGRAD